MIKSCPIGNVQVPRRNGKATAANVPSIATEVAEAAQQFSGFSDANHQALLAGGVSADIKSAFFESREAGVVHNQPMTQSSRAGYVYVTPSSSYVALYLQTLEEILFVNFLLVSDNCDFQMNENGYGPGSTFLDISRCWSQGLEYNPFQLSYHSQNPVTHPRMHRESLTTL